MKSCALYSNNIYIYIYEDIMYKDVNIYKDTTAYMIYITAYMTYMT